MAFFTQAKRDGTIDERIDMSEEEFKMMVVGKIQDSNAWHRHMMQHKDARLVPIMEEDSDSKLDRSVRGRKPAAQPEESMVIYNEERKFHAGCQCGEKFEFDTKSDSVNQMDSNPNLRMKQVENYRRDEDNNRGSGKTNSYGMPQSNSSRNSQYGFVRHSGSSTSSYGKNEGGQYGR